MIQLRFNIDLPETDIQVGFFDGPWPVDPQSRLGGSSLRGVEGREFSRLFPLLVALEALTQVDQWQLSREQFAPLYDSGVYYKNDKPGREEWDDTPTMYARGWGDCKKLCAARCAEYRMAGIPAMPAITWKEFQGPRGRITLVHCLVLLPDNDIEDPSKVLGMKGEYSDDV